MDMGDSSKETDNLLLEINDLKNRISELETERRTLREKEKWFKKLLEAMNDGVVALDEVGRIIYVNPKACQTLGYDCEEIIGHRADEFVADDYVNKFGLEFAKRVQEERGVYEFEIKRPDGQTISVIYSASPLFDDDGRLKGSIGVLTDINLRKRTEEVITTEKDLFKSLAESSPFGLVVVSKRGDFEYLNPKFTEMFGYNLSDLPNGNSWIEKAYPDPDYRHEVVRVWKEDLSSANLHDLRPRTFTVRCRDGSDKVIHFRPVRLESGRDIMTCEDVTDRKQLEIELAEAIEELKQSNLETVGLLSSARSVLESDNFKQAARYILKRALKLIEAQCGHLSALDSQGEMQNVLWFEPGEQVCDLDPSQDIPVTGLHRRVYNMKRAFFRNDLDLEGDSLDLPKGHVNLENILMVPLVAQNNTLGLLALGNKNGGFTEGDAQLAEAFAEIAAIGLLNWRIAEQLEKSEERYRMIFANSPLGIMHYDKQGVILDFNDQFLNILGAPAERLHGFRMLERLTDPSLLEAIKASLAGRTGHYEGDYHSVTGDRDVPLRAVFNSVTSERGEFLGGVGIYEDLSSLRVAEKALVQHERVRAVADLAGGVAHNFNNLLQIIMGSLELSLIDLEAGRYAKARESIQWMRDSVRLGAETVRRLQTFARIRVEGHGEDRKVFDVSQVVFQAVEISKPWWKDNRQKDGGSISLRQKVEKGMMIEGLENQIFEVVTNLIKNAVEACSHGGNVDVSIHSDDGFAVIEVADTGSGIPEEFLGKIFDPFWTSKKTNIGTGLGLAVCHGIVETHGGAITATSKVGVGTVFTVKLPLSDRQLLEEPLEQSFIPLAHRVLIIDDMEPIVEMLGQVLEQMDYTIFSALSGEQAIDIFKSEDVDVVICDLVMPGIDGLKVGQALKAICMERKTPKTPFILLTGWGGQTMEDLAVRESGIDAILEKPVDMKRLLDTIGKLAAAPN
jgi:PAS domain S-box-containing protein